MRFADFILHNAVSLLKLNLREETAEKIIAVCNEHISFMNKDGSAASGNWGHESVKGVRGGSAPGGGKSNRIGSGKYGYTSKAKQNAIANAQSKSWKSSVASMREETHSLNDGKKAQALIKAYGATKGDTKYEEIYSAFKAKDGSLDTLVDDYYDILEESGDPTPVKQTSKQVTSEMEERISEGEFGDGSNRYKTARKEYISEVTGMEGDELDATYSTLQTWFGGGWLNANTERLDNYIDSDHAYDGETYRGLRFYDEDSFNSFMSTVSNAGDVITSKDGKNTSWSTDISTATRFAGTANDYDYSVVIHNLSNKTASPVDHLSVMGESEVLAHSKTQWTVLRTEVTQKGYGGDGESTGKRADVYVIENAARAE